MHTRSYTPYIAAQHQELSITIRSIGKSFARRMKAMGFRGSVELRVHINATAVTFCIGGILCVLLCCRKMKNSKILLLTLVRCVKILLESVARLLLPSQRARRRQLSRGRAAEYFTRRVSVRGGTRCVHNVILALDTAPRHQPILGCR